MNPEIMGKNLLLNLINVNIGYAQSDKSINLVVSDINLKLYKGDCVSLLGISGCGKSTILHAICGFLPLQSGKIEFSDITSEMPRISIAFQESTLFPWLTVEENISYGDWISRQKNKTKVVNNLLEEFGVPGTNKLYPKQLSGGMKQRIDIARAIANNPDILILDEPFGQLDYQNRLQSEKLLLNVIKEKGIATLLVTHNVEEAIYLSDSIYVLGGKPATINRMFYVDKKGLENEYEIRFSREFIDMKRDIEEMLINEFNKRRDR